MTREPIVDAHEAYQRAHKIARALRDVPGAKVQLRSVGSPPVYVRPTVSKPVARENPDAGLSTRRFWQTQHYGRGPWEICVFDGAQWSTSRPIKEARDAYARAHRIARSLRDVPGAKVKIRSTAEGTFWKVTGPSVRVRPNPSACTVAKGAFDLYGQPYAVELRDDCSVLVRSAAVGGVVGMGRWSTAMRVENFRLSETFQEIGGHVDIDTVEQAATEVLREAARPAASADADLVIEHTVEHGTTISGDTRQYNQAIKNLGGGFKWWPAGKVWYRQQSRGRATPSVALEVWAQRLRAAGATVAVRQQVPVSQEEERAVRQSVLEEKAARAHARAERAAAESQQQYGQFRRVADAIPMGQPILVGHHSERRHRKDIARMDTSMHKAIEAQRSAERLEARAERLEREAARLESPVVAQVEDDNAFNERLAKLLSTQLKRRFGFKSIRQSSKGQRDGIDWRIFYLWGPPKSLDMRLSGQLVELAASGWSGRVALPLPRAELRTPAEAYERIADLVRAYLSR